MSEAKASRARRSRGSKGASAGPARERPRAPDLWSRLLNPEADAADRKRRREADKRRRRAEAAEAAGEQPEEGEPQPEDDDDQEEEKLVVAQPPALCESFVLFVGDSGAGKSSLIASFLGQGGKGGDERVKPTTALEYLFARRSAAAGQKDIAHIWELGGRMRVRELVGIPITPERLARTVVVIVVDLAQPGDALASLVRWVRVVRAHVAQCVATLRQTDPAAADAVVAAARRRFGDAHADAGAVDPCPVPLLILANKYDVFQDNDSLKRKYLSQALRFVAHRNGASLLSVSTQESALRAHFKALMNQHLFRSPPKRAFSTSGEGPLVVPAGSDGLDDILRSLPPGVSGPDLDASGDDMWIEALAGIFAPSSQAAGSANIDEFFESAADSSRGVGGMGLAGEGKEAEFPEPAVDAAREAKDEELVRFRREAERRARLAGGGARRGSSGSSGRSRGERGERAERGERGERAERKK